MLIVEKTNEAIYLLAKEHLRVHINDLIYIKDRTIESKTRLKAINCYVRKLEATKESDTIDDNDPSTNPPDQPNLTSNDQ